MKDWKFQIVFQFEATGSGDFSDLLELENSLYKVLPGQIDGVVDGHDFGMGEFNIFIHSNEVPVTFERTADLVNELKPGVPFSAGYRAFSEEVHTPLWPPGSTTFSVA